MIRDKNKLKFGMIAFLVLLFAMLACISIGNASAATTYYVNPGESIQAAVDSANAGDTIIVRDGTYNENVEVNVSYITIKSENGSGKCSVNALVNTSDVFVVSVDHVNISGFTVTGATVGKPYYSVRIHLDNASYCNISDNVVMNNCDGIHLYSSGNIQNGGDWLPLTMLALTPTPTPLFGKKPDPYFPFPGDVHVKYEYSATGVAIGGTVIKEVRNRGGSGEVFVSVRWLTGGYNSRVFYMDKDESVMVGGYFKGLMSFGHGEKRFEWTVRPSLPSDTSQGRIDIERSNMKRVGLYAPSDSTILDVAVVGDFAYVIVENYWTDHGRPTLCVVDISNPLDPREIGHYSFSECAGFFFESELSMAGNYAYVTIGHSDIGHLYKGGENGLRENGLHIIDVSDPSNPKEVGQYLTGEAEPPRGVAVLGNYAYVITQKHHLTSGHLLIIDVGDPSNLKEIGQCEIGGTLSVAVKGNYAYLAGYSYLYIIDISTPNTPKEIGRYHVKTGTACRITIMGNYAYMMVRNCSLYILDITNPSNLTEVWHYYPKGKYTGYDVAASENYAYLGASEGLLVIDISNPDSPTEVGRYTGGRIDGKGVAVSGNYVYLGGMGGLHVLESNPIR